MLRGNPVFMIKLRKMLFSIAFCALMWSAPQVVAWHWYYTSTIQPSPSLTMAQSAILPTPSIQVRSKLSRGHCGYGQVSCRDGNGCIPASWDCDWYVDCSDRSDEDHCGSSLLLSASQTSSAIQASSSQRLLAVTSTVQVVQYCYYYWLFRCRNGQCISRYNLCNGRYDCYDGSDEDWYQCQTSQISSSIQPSSTPKSLIVTSTMQYCNYWQFRCRSGQCISRYNLCNGRYDCYDGSDEDWYQCQTSHISSSIQPSSTLKLSEQSSTVQYCYYYWQFRCRNSQCISRYNLCDGRYDCYDGSDEDWYQCQTSQISSSIQPSSTQKFFMVTSTMQYCYYWQFRCRSGQCISRYYLCDGFYDCYDGSDEDWYQCQTSQVSSSIQPSSTEQLLFETSTVQYCYYYWQFRCRNGQCISRYNLCDGRYDCYDGSDEDWHQCQSKTSQISSSIQPSSTKQSLMVTSPVQYCYYYWQFRCRNGQCISRYDLCNGRYDCYDGSDEDWYQCQSKTSHISSSIQPSSTLQIPESSTVQYCYYYWQFRCRNGQCISRYNLCNGRYDCYDGSDEDWYQCRTRTGQISSSIQPSSTLLLIMSSSVPIYCGSWQFRCRNGKCISKNKLCNNYNDCGDQSDERYSVCRGANMTKCQNKLDLGFVLDSSGSVGYTNFQRMKLFVKDLTDFYKLGPDETRVSVMSFSNSAYIHISFSGYFADKNQFDSAVDRIGYGGGGTATAMALNMAYNDMFTSRYGARGTEVKKVLVILTDGQSNTGQVSGPARQLKNSGVVIFSVGIGQSLSMQELRSMASDPVDQHVITLNNFSELARLAEQMSSQTCNASRFQVLCDNDFMTAVFVREDLPKHVNIDRLYFRHRSCRARWNSTHVIAKASLTGCGTVFSKTEQTLFFTNLLSDEGQGRGVGVITRDYLFRANLTCTYPRKRTVGSFSFAPAKQRLFVSVGGQGNFSLSLDVFKSSDYRQPYTPQDYPVLKSLSDNLYIQYYINTSNSNLVVRAETCRATPTNHAYASPQYVFISDGCDRDETIRHYTRGLSRIHRFSIQAFRFLSEHRFVYLHCDLVVCHGYDHNSTCARSTSCSKRYRRGVDEGSDDASSMYSLSFGPIMQGKESIDQNTEAPSRQAMNTTLVGSLIGFGCLSLVLIGALIYMIKRSRRTRSDPAKIVQNNEGLSLQNLGYTST